MSLTFKKIGDVAKTLATEKQNKGTINSIHNTIMLSEASKQPLPTQQEITLFEEQANITLPKDYKNFLLTINGGYPSYYYIPTVESTVDHFYSLNCPYPTSSMNDLLMLNKKDLFKDGLYRYIPIACSLNGDEYLMTVTPQQENDIFLYKFSEFPLSDFNESQLIFVAGSFSTLLNLLVPYETAFKL